MGVIDHALEHGPAVPWEARSEADRQRICATPEPELG
jgi:hypothetical protein